MAENSRAATLQLVEGHCYALQVVPAPRDHAFAHKSISNGFEIVRTSRLTLLGSLTFDDFPDFRQAISFYVETMSPGDNAHPLGTAFVDDENPQITVILDAASLTAIAETLRIGIDVSFQLTGLAVAQERLEIVEFCYDYEF